MYTLFPNGINGVMNEKEFLALIKENNKLISHLLHLYLDNREEKKDMYQEIMVQAWTGIERFKAEAKFSTWLYKVALFTILTAKRKEKKVKWVSIDGIEKSSEVETSSTDQREVLIQAIRRLSEVDKTLLTMHLDGFSNTEIADFMGITLNNCQVKLHRVKEQVTKMIQKK